MGQKEGQASLDIPCIRHCPNLFYPNTWCKNWGQSPGALAGDGDKKGSEKKN